MIEQQTMEKYAELALKTGVNLQKGQALMINAPLEGMEFTKKSRPESLGIRGERCTC